MNLDHPIQPMLRLATWNMRGASSRSTRHWDYLQNQLKIDLAMVQEADPPVGILRASSARQFCKRADHCAIHIVSFNNSIHVVAEEPLGEGTVLPATVSELDDLLIMNAHAIRNTEARESKDYQGFRRAVDAVEMRANEKRPIVVVGDFNASVHLKYDAHAFLKQFRRLANLGFRDLLCDSGCSPDADNVCRTIHPHSRTHGDKTFRIDYFYGNESARELLVRAYTDEHQNDISLSDHRPIVAEFARKARSVPRSA